MREVVENSRDRLPKPTLDEGSLLRAKNFSGVDHTNILQDAQSHKALTRPVIGPKRNQIGNGLAPASVGRVQGDSGHRHAQIFNDEFVEMARALVLALSQ